jgi:general secretion pathway protein G
MLVVIIILGILAMIIIPQITVSTEDAKTSTLQGDLSAIRSGLELYYAQHANTYPAQAVPTTKPDDVTTLAGAFVAQLTRYTDGDGNIANAKTDVFKYGPYLKGTSLPTNPFNDKSDVTVDNTETDITKKSSAGAGTGWKFYSKTGVFMAADGSHDTD